MEGEKAMEQIEKKPLYWFISGIRRVGIFSRLFLAFIILISISSGVLISFSYLRYAEQIHLNLEKQILLLVQNVSYKTRDTMNTYEDLAVSFYDDREVLEAIAQNEELYQQRHRDQNTIDQNTALIENRLYKLRGNHKFLESIQFVSGHSQYSMHDTGGFLRGAMIRNLDSFYSSDFYQKTISSNGYPIWFDGKDQSSVFIKSRQSIYGLADILTMTVAVYHPEHREFLGILLFNVDLAAFSDALSGFSYDKSGNVFLIGHEGVLIGLNPSIDAPSFPKDMTLFQKILDENDPVSQHEVGGNKLLMAYAPVSGSGLTATYIASVDTLEKPLVEIRNRCLIVWAITVAVSWLIAYFVTVSISVPVRDLIGTFKSMESGDWSIRYPNSGHDEITILGNQYNEMADEIEKLVNTVYLSEIKRQQLQLSWKNAQLDALMMQINPHFLYNTLDIIRWEAMYEAKGESRVTQMIEKFSRLCRESVQTGTDTVSLRKGLDHAKTYLDVINFRHKEKIALNIYSEVEEEKVFVPRSLIQPILENAVIHAFAEKVSGCAITVASRRMEGDLQITITDNGSGMTSEQLSSLLDAVSQQENSEKSLGLRNVHQRIRLFYGDAYGLSIRSIPGKGSEVTICLPYREYSEKMENI